MKRELAEKQYVCIWTDDRIANPKIRECLNPYTVILSILWTRFGKSVDGCRFGALGEVFVRSSLYSRGFGALVFVQKEDLLEGVVDDEGALLA